MQYKLGWRCGGEATGITSHLEAWEECREEPLLAPMPVSSSSGPLGAQQLEMRFQGSQGWSPLELGGLRPEGSQLPSQLLNFFRLSSWACRDLSPSKDLLPKPAVLSLPGP